jgi:hypothetical protein
VSIGVTSCLWRLDAEVCVGGLIIRRCRLRWVIHGLLVDEWWGGRECVEGFRNPRPATNLRFQARLINESLKKVLERCWAVISNARNGLAGVREG